MFNKKLKLDGLRSGKPIEDLYDRIAKEKGIKYIKDIKFPMLVTATNVVDEKEYIFTSNRILDNVPVDEVKKMGADKVIAVKFNSDKINKFSNVMDIAMKTVDMMGNKISELNLLNSDLVVTIDTDGTGLLDIENSEYCFNSGYIAGMNNMEKIKFRNKFTCKKD